MFLKISDLKKYYNENEPLIRNLNFSVNRGEIVSFIGESGSGKTTFLKCSKEYYNQFGEKFFFKT